MIRKAYKFRIYPNNEQKIFFAKCFGCVRFFYNKSLSDMIDIYGKSKKFENITPARYKSEYAFLKEADALALCNAQLNRNSAFKAYYTHRNSFPKFKSKKHKQSYTTNNHVNSIHFDDDSHISIPKCFHIKIKKHRECVGLIKSATISKTCDDKYYISILVEADQEKASSVSGVIGIDLGVKDILTTSNGVKYSNKKFFNVLSKKIAKEQSRLCKMKMGSNNREKQRIKIATLCQKMRNRRIDYLHKISKRIIDENQVICVEDLNVVNMSKGNYYNKDLFDASMARLLTMLNYKAHWYGRTIIGIPTEYPSSQLCNNCGYKDIKLKDLKVREWECPSCGCKHDRDINAAKNILKKGLSILKDGAHPDSLFKLEP